MSVEIHNTTFWITTPYNLVMNCVKPRTSQYGMWFSLWIVNNLVHSCKKKTHTVGTIALVTIYTGSFSPTMANSCTNLSHHYCLDAFIAFWSLQLATVHHKHWFTVTHHMDTDTLWNLQRRTVEMHCSSCHNVSEIAQITQRPFPLLISENFSLWHCYSTQQVPNWALTNA
jgi:hypothetical protein